MDEFSKQPKGIFKTFSEELHEDSDDTHPMRWLETDNLIPFKNSLELTDKELAKVNNTQKRFIYKLRNKSIES